MKLFRKLLPYFLSALFLFPFSVEANRTGAYRNRMLLPQPISSGALRIEAAEVFKSSGTWYRDAGVDFVLAIVVGGGGGGATDVGATGGGGGQGGQCRVQIIDVRGTTSETVTVGTGGATDTGGGSSSFGTLLTSEGGDAGTSTNGGGSGDTTHYGGGRGGVPSSGVNAQAGLFGAGGTTNEGAGGGGSYGAGATGGSGVGASAAAYSGGGGAGGGDGGDAGGSGGSGIVIIIPLVANEETAIKGLEDLYNQ